jgi:hypothetical protein
MLWIGQRLQELSTLLPIRQVSLSLLPTCHRRAWRAMSPKLHPIEESARVGANQVLGQHSRDCSLLILRHLQS